MDQSCFDGKGKEVKEIVLEINIGSSPDKSMNRNNIFKEQNRLFKKFYKIK